MTVDTLIEDDRWEQVGFSVLAQAAEAAVADALGFDPSAFEISLLACDDARIAQLNTDFRGKARPTNVLSWPSQERGAATEGAVPAAPVLPMDEELGDIAIAYDTCAAEAAAQGKELTAHVTHLLVHGTLHLLGYDHVRDGDAALMEELERQILGKMGLPDPYSI